MTQKEQTVNIEEAILRENIVSAAGLSSHQVLTGIKGDPSLPALGQ